jgi:predicted MPP superfamily phosphohydrolase
MLQVDGLFSPVETDTVLTAANAVTTLAPPASPTAALPQSWPAPKIEKLRKGPWLQIGQPTGFEWNRITLPVADLSPQLASLRVLHLTDLHLRPGWGPSFDELIDRTRANPPDLILLTGDLVEHHFDPRPAFETADRLVSNLAHRFGKYAILGNHDGDLLGPMLEGWGLTMINGRTRRLSINGAPIDLVGLLGVSRRDLTDEFIHRVPAHEPGVLRIVMSHYPDAVRRIGSIKADVVLAGHTHGGQLCFPNGRPLMTHDTLPKSMCQGVHRINNTWLIIGRGLGFSSWPLRTFCPAEVIEVGFEAI